MKTTEELRKLDGAKLQAEIQTLEKELYSLTIKALGNQNKKVDLIGKHKKQIARIHTIIKEQEDAATVAALAA